MRKSLRSGRAKSRMRISPIKQQNNTTYSLTTTKVFYLEHVGALRHVGVEEEEEGGRSLQQSVLEEGAAGVGNLARARVVLVAAEVELELEVVHDCLPARGLARECVEGADVGIEFVLGWGQNTNRVRDETQE